MIGASLRDGPERFYRFMMGRHHAGTASLAVPHRDGGRRSRKVQVPTVQLQRFRLPQRGAPQQQSEQPGLATKFHTASRYENRSSGRSHCDGHDQINRAPRFGNEPKDAEDTKPCDQCVNGTTPTNLSCENNSIVRTIPK